MYICHPTKSPLYTFVSSYRTYTPFTWEENQQESESPIGRPPTSTPVVPPAATTSSGVPTGGTTGGGAALGAAQILGTPAVLVSGAPWAPDPFGALQLIRELDSKIESKIDPLKREIEALKSKNKHLEDRVKNLEDKNKQGQEKLEEQNKHLEDKNKEIELLKSKGEERLETLEHRVKQVEDKNKELVGKIKQLESKNKELGGKEVEGGSRIKELEQKLKKLEDKNEKLEGRVKHIESENKDVDVVPTPVTDNVQQWKRIACEEVLKVFATHGKAPLVKATANHAYSCYDTRCSYENRTNCLDTYIKHLLDNHNVNVRDKSLTVAHRNEFLPVQYIS